MHTNASDMVDDPAVIAAHVDAAAALLAMPLDDARRAAVIVAMTRIAAFARDVAAVPLGDDVEISGVFVP
jgi:hypothetical protein